jgi:hypothetical protein
MVEEFLLAGVSVLVEAAKYGLLTVEGVDQ